MNDLLSPGSLVTIAGGVLTVVGAVAYGTGAANLSLPTIFYGIPILLGGLALKSSELPPTRRVTPKAKLKGEREAATPELGKLLGDVTVGATARKPIWKVLWNRSSFGMRTTPHSCWRLRRSAPVATTACD